MAEPNHGRTSFGIDTTTMARGSLQSSADDVDDYDLAAMGISDGFRSVAPALVGSSRIASLSSQHQRRSTPPPRPSSATKPRHRDSSALKYDGAIEALPRPAAAAAAAAAASPSRAGSTARSSSSSADLPFVRAESPYQGPAGPSHPYHMYTQNTRLARTASIATTSTVQARSEGSYNGPSGPQHPYGMYAQNIAAETDSLHNGEEAATLGHTEQLPPYTRYPEERGARDATPALPHLPGAGGIGLATRNPEFASREDLSAPLSSTQSYRRSMTSDSGDQINTAAVVAAEKPAGKKWKIIAGRKVWGIVPNWVFFLVGVMVLVLTIILGAVLVMLSHRRSSNSSSPKPASSDAATGFIYATVTTTYDASPLSTAPPGIPALPTGTYILPIVSPFVQQPTCLDKDSLYAAWSCDVRPGSIEMTVTPSTHPTSNNSGNRVTICGNGLSSSLYYGTQPPQIDPDAILSLVDDSDQTRLGPAWYFRAVYDKIVVVHESDLPSPSKTKRDIPQRDFDYQSSKAVAEDGDRPWFCRWEGTILETFIYVNQTSNYSGDQQTTLITPSPATATLPSPTIAVSSGGSIPQVLFDNYPGMVKLEERRDPADSLSKAPYCVQMIIRADDSAVPLLSDDGDEIIIYLNETEPSLTFPASKRGEPGLLNSPEASEPMERRDTSILHMCRCVWLT